MSKVPVIKKGTHVGKKKSNKKAKKPSKVISCSEQSRCNAHWCKEPMIISNNEFLELQKIINTYTDIVTVGPAGFKPLHNGHLKVIKMAFIVAQKIIDENIDKNVLVLINTSCAGREKGSEFEMKRG